MGIDRRSFIKIAGLSALGVAAKSATDLIAEVNRPPQTVRAGKRLAMVVDLRKCKADEGCIDCIKACHSVHNVPDFRTPDGEVDLKVEVKWIWQDHFEHAFHEHEHEFLEEKIRHKTVLLLCNHCDNPPCVKVCPTQATWKREEDGIVMMDWHRCIGCRYCIAACPYGSRSFNWSDPREVLKETDPSFPTRMKGVVEKCTFCEERITRGQIPACVKVCKEGALVYGDLRDPDSAVRNLLRLNYSIRRKPGLGTQPEIYYIV